MQQTVVERAHAKVNLILRVGPLQADGYHPVATVLHFIELHDLVHIEVEPGGGPRSEAAPEVRVTVDRPGVPEGRENLAWQAVEALMPEIERAGKVPRRIHVHIEKVIPAAAGLGGGSADAAAVLRGLNRALSLGLGEDALARYGGALGADVPACIAGGTVVCTGRGERIAARIEAKPLWWVLANPGKPLSTPEVYRAFDRLGQARPAPEPGASSGEIEALTEGLLAGDPRRVAAWLANDLQPAACALLPEIARVLAWLDEGGALAGIVSGSGPTVCGLVEGEAAAAALARELRGRGIAWVWQGPSQEVPMQRAGERDEAKP